MTKLATFTLAGASGREYTFNVYALNTKFAEVAAVYVVTKRYQRSDGVWAHDVDYVGQTGNLPERFEDHHKAACFKRYGANCVCVHRDDNEASRLVKEADLIEAHDPPCNG